MFEIQLAKNAFFTWLKAKERPKICQHSERDIFITMEDSSLIGGCQPE